MKKTVVLALLLLTLCGCSLLNTSGEYKDRAIAIQNLVAEIKLALTLVDKKVQETNLTLNNAVLTINTEIGESQEGGAALWMVSGIASRDKLSSDKVIIKLIPEPIGPADLTYRSSEEMLSKRLAMSIIAAAEGVSDVGTGKYPMQLSNLTIEMGITTKTVGAAGIQFEVIPISASMKGIISRSNLDILKLEFTRKEQT